MGRNSRFLGSFAVHLGDPAGKNALAIDNPPSLLRLDLKPLQRTPQRAERLPCQTLVDRLAKFEDRHPRHPLGRLRLEILLRLKPWTAPHRGFHFRIRLSRCLRDHCNSLLITKIRAVIKMMQLRARSASLCGSLFK